MWLFRLQKSHRLSIWIDGKFDFRFQSERWFCSPARIGCLSFFLSIFLCLFHKQRHRFKSITDRPQLRLPRWFTSTRGMFVCACVRERERMCKQQNNGKVRVSLCLTPANRRAGRPPACLTDEQSVLIRGNCAAGQSDHSQTVFGLKLLKSATNYVANLLFYPSRSEKKDWRQTCVSSKFGICSSDSITRLLLISGFEHRVGQRGSERLSQMCPLGGLLLHDLILRNARR